MFNLCDFLYVNCNMDIAIGTYEHYVLGYSLVKKGEENFELELRFSTQDHLSSVSSIASSQKYLASGGNDETINLFNMKKKEKIGALVHHNGSVTDLCFYENSHLFSCSDDGTIAAWTTNNWQCVKTLRGHKSGVVSCAVHPSGKMILSVSKDKTLRTWNLVKGRTAYVTNIKAVAEFVHWSPSGRNFLVGINNRVDVYDVQTAGIIYTIDFGKRVICAAFLTEDIIILGGECHNIGFFSINKQASIHNFKAHDNRIKGIQIVNHPDGIENTKMLVTTSSDSFIKVWELDINELNKIPKLVAEVDTSCRPTCLTAWISAES